MKSHNGSENGNSTTKLIACCVPGTVLSTLCTLSFFVFDPMRYVSPSSPFLVMGKVRLGEFKQAAQ